MANTILFIFEGEKTEKQITDNLTKYFITVNGDTIVQCAFCTDIYRLYGEIYKDNDLDIFLLLKEIEKNKAILSQYSRTDFAEIYLFFDYDGHASTADDEKIKELLIFFNEETDIGKLFISYPMVESLKHYSSTINFEELKVKAKENINYKRKVSDETDNKLQDLTKYTEEIWIGLIALHLKKMSFIVNGNFNLPTALHTQKEIFDKQLEKYIAVDSTVAVLSSFPVFLLDYYGIKKLTLQIENCPKDFSQELSESTLINGTKEIELSKVLSESDVVSGVYFIDALTANQAKSFIDKELAVLNAVRGLFKNPKNLVESVISLQKENKRLKNEFEQISNT